MQIETLAVVRPPTTGDQELASRLLKGLEDTSHNVTMYTSPELCAITTQYLSGTALLVVSPGQCIEASGDEPTFLSKVASAQKRILASASPVDSPWYRGRLSRGILFDAVLDFGFASQRDRHSEVSDLPYHFVFNGLIREEEPLAGRPAHQAQRTIPWVLVGPKNDKNRNLLAELLEHDVDPGGLCLLHARLKNMAKPAPMLGGPQLSAVLSKARYYLWGGDRDVPYYESFRFIGPLLAGTVPCKIDPDLAAEGLDIPGLYTSVSSFEAEVQNIGYLAMYRRGRDFYVSRGRLAEHLSEALPLV
jgi:hypothetical protein